MRHGFAIHLKQDFIFIAIPVTIVVDGNGKLFKRLSKGMVLFGEKKTMNRNELGTICYIFADYRQTKKMCREGAYSFNNQFYIFLHVLSKRTRTE